VYLSTNVALSYKRILCMEAAYTNCFAGSSNTYTDKTPVLDFSVSFAHPFVDGKPYYSNGLFSNESIDLTSIGL